MENSKLNITFLDCTNNQEITDTANYAYKDYTIDDCIIVRTTNVFPLDGIIKTPIHGNAYEFGNSTLIGEAIGEILSAKYPNYFFDEEHEKGYKEEKKDCQVVFETLRRTTHFVMNGVVQSHTQGNFDNSPIVIMDPLKYHMDSSLKCLRVEDVYFDDDLTLSNEAVIMIDENSFNKISNNLESLETLQRFKVVVYRGDKQAAVKQTLESLGYDFFLISTNGYTNGLDDNSAAKTMYDFCSDFAEKNNISLDKHFRSEINVEDTKNRRIKGEEIDKLHLSYLLDNSSINESKKEQIKILLETNANNLKEVLRDFVNEIGLEQIKKLTKEFNDGYINTLGSSKNKISSF